MAAMGYLFPDRRANPLPEKTNSPIIEADYPAFIEEKFYGI
jgi:hypothetical protein